MNEYSKYKVLLSAVYSAGIEGFIATKLFETVDWKSAGYSKYPLDLNEHTEVFMELTKILNSTVDDPFGIPFMEYLPDIHAFFQKYYWEINDLFYQNQAIYIDYFNENSHSDIISNMVAVSYDLIAKKLIRKLMASD